MTDEPRSTPVGIDTDINMLLSGIESLRDLASDPEGSQDGSRIYDFNVRWGTLMSGRLRRLEHYYRAGELPENQNQSYRRLRSGLQEAMPLIERLGLTRPQVPLED